MVGIGNKIKKSEKGMTLLEALVSTAIIGIGSREFKNLLSKNFIEINSKQKYYKVLN